MTDYIKKICAFCSCVIVSVDDEEQIQVAANKIEIFHKGCLKEYERQVKAEKKRRSKGGRPTVVTPEVIKRLEYGLTCGMNDLEICAYAGICDKTLDNFEKKNPEFVRLKGVLRSQPNMTSKINLKESIDNGNIPDSKWSLEKTDEAFNPKQKQDVTVGGNTSLINAILAKKAAKDES